MSTTHTHTRSPPPSNPLPSFPSSEVSCCARCLPIPVAQFCFFRFWVSRRSSDRPGWQPEEERIALGNIQAPRQLYTAGTSATPLQSRLSCPSSVRTKCQRHSQRLPYTPAVNKTRCCPLSHVPPLHFCFIFFLPLLITVPASLGHPPWVLPGITHHAETPPSSALKQTLTTSACWNIRRDPALTPSQIPDAFGLHFTLAVPVLHQLVFAPGSPPLLGSCVSSQLTVSFVVVAGVGIHCASIS